MSVQPGIYIQAEKRISVVPWNGEHQFFDSLQSFSDMNTAELDERLLNDERMDKSGEFTMCITYLNINISSK